MRDLVGWLALAISMSGLIALAHGKRVGWLLRCISGVLWIAFAVLTGAGPYIATASIYLAIDLYAVTRKRPAP